MLNLLLALHVLLAVFAIGPLVHATTTASRGIRRGDGAATAASARMARIYALVSVLVVLVGFGLMSMKSPSTHQPLGAVSQTWVWLSGVLWLLAVGLVLGLLVPTLDKATAQIGRGESVVGLTGRVAAAGGLVGLIFAVIVALMVYRPGA